MTVSPRRTIRRKIDAEVILRRSLDQPYKVKLRDLSLNGCSVELVNHVQLGERLWIKLPGLDSIEGFVRWEENFRAGSDFLTPLHPAVFDMLLQKYED